MAIYKFVIILAIACALNGSANADETCKDFPSGDTNSCCAFPSKNQAQFEECAKAKWNEKGCPMDCAYDTAKVFANDGIDKDVMMSGTTKYLDGEDPAWSPVFEKAIDACIARIKEHKPDDTKPKEHKGHHGGKCNFKAMMMMHCVHHEVFQNCPANAWTSNAECDAWKTFSAKCPFAHKHGHHEAAE